MTHLQVNGESKIEQHSQFSFQSFTCFAMCASVLLFPSYRQRINGGGFLKAFHVSHGGGMISWRWRWTLKFSLFAWCFGYMTFDSGSWPRRWFAIHFSRFTANKYTHIKNRIKVKFITICHSHKDISIFANVFYFVHNLLHCFAIAAKEVGSYSIFVQ